MLVVEKLVSTKELAEYLGIKEMTVYKHVKEGKIPVLHVGKLLRFDMEMIQKLLQEGKLFKRRSL